MEPNFYNKSIITIGYARVTFPAGVPTYLDVTAPLGTAKAAVGFDTSIAPIDNGVGDTTLTLVGIQAGAALLVDIHADNAVAASGLQCFGYTLPTADTIRITSLQEGAAGAASALTDIPFTVEVRALAPNYLGG